MSHSVWIPPGTRHHNTSVFCESWEVYDSFTFEQRRREGTIWKTATLGEDSTVTIFPPVGVPRPRLEANHA